DLQWLSENRQVATRDALHDMLRVLGDLSAEEITARTLTGVDAAPMVTALEREGRAISLRIGGEARWIDAADAGLYRDALGAVPPGGLPTAFLGDVPGALPRPPQRHAGTRGRAP